MNEIHPEKGLQLFWYQTINIYKFLTSELKYDYNNQLYPQLKSSEGGINYLARYDAEGYLYGMRCIMFVVAVIAFTFKKDIIFVINCYDFL